MNINRKIQKVKTAEQKLNEALGEIEDKIKPFIKFGFWVQIMPGDGIVVKVDDDEIDPDGIKLMPLDRVIEIINDAGCFSADDIDFNSI